MGVWMLLLMLAAAAVDLEAQTVNDADIVILLDSSDQLRSTNFDEEKKFTTALASQLFTSGTRLSVYTFGTDAYSQFALDTYSDISMILQGIQYMWYSTGVGSVTSAFSKTVQEAFQKDAGDRECVANYLIVLTHSAASDRTQAESVKTLLSQKKIRTLIVNMAGHSAFENLSVITADSSLVVDVNSWLALQSSPHGIQTILMKDRPSTGCGLLSAWGNWTGCSVSCGQGFKFRTRACIKEDVTDKDCTGELSDDMECTMPDCTEPVDGSWTFWGKWGPCSKTCGTGSQQRTRLCNQPAPVNGGKQCPGSSVDTRNCATFSCPDCSRRCPPGGQLSPNCEVCQCSQVSIYGQLLNDGNATVEGAEVYLDSAPYKPIATTDSTGHFRADGVCLMNEKIAIVSKGCLDKHVTPVSVNSTHWTLPSMRLERTVAPVFTVQPEDKVRMVGQSLSLCCKAVGIPQPTSYKWYQNKVELVNQGTDGTLVLSSAQLSHSGTYTCFTETEAGPAMSEEAEVSIHPHAQDTCGTPEPLLQELPHGCHVAGDTSGNSTMNVGTCGNLPCSKSALHDNGSCSDYWTHHCCEVKDVQTVDVMCDGFSYKTTIIQSCECKPCVYKTTVFGRVFGRVNGKEVPLQLGVIIINGKETGHTSMAGTFKLDFPKGTKRIVANFHDSIFKKFSDVTKIITVNSGKDTFVTVVVPLKPTPIPFHNTNGTEIDLGLNANGEPPAAKLSIPSDAIRTPDGQLYNGTVKASIHFMDPRNRDDIDAANGEFQAEAPDGSQIPLKTFGMFHFAVEDEHGSELTVNKKLKFTLDGSLFNVPLDANGNPDLSLWSYDANKGIWVEIGKMQKETTSRKKRQVSASFAMSFHPPNLPVIDQYNTVTQKVFTGRYTNCDHSVPIYQTVTSKVPKAGSCFLSVSVYNDLSLKTPYGASDIEIRTYVRELNGGSYIGSDRTVVLNNGHACIPIFCDKTVYLSVIRNGQEMFYPGQHYLPVPGIVKNTTNNEVVFESRDFGVAAQQQMLQNQPHIKPNTVFQGPVYQLAAKGTCARQTATGNSFMFKFAPFTTSPRAHFVVGSGVFDKKLSWYPVSPSTNTFRSCFMKVAVKINGTYDLRLVAKSFMNDPKGDEFGTYDVGPTPGSNSNDMTTRGACFEFRCPGLIHDGSSTKTNIPTAVSVYLNSQRRDLKCKIENVKSGLTVSGIPDSRGGIKGFSFTANAGNNYGEKYGIFISNNPAPETLKQCEAGTSFGNGQMSPMNNPAFELNCL